MFARTTKEQRRPEVGRPVAVALVSAGVGFAALSGCGAPQPATTCPEPAAAVAATSSAALTVAPARVVAGPMLGYATMREATVWLQTDGPATVELEYWEVDAAGLPFVTDPPLRSVRALASTDHTHVARAPDLEPGSFYDYRVVVDGQAHEPPDDARLRTQPLWRWQSNPPVPPDLTIAVGSCSYVNEAAYDRAGDPWGGGYSIFDRIADTRPDFMLWLGDNVYFREVDWQSRSGLLYRYTYERRLPELQRLLATTRHYATWDDHDYGPNDSDRGWFLKNDARDVFMAYWPNPSYGRDGQGIYTQFALADVDVILLDDRWWRSPDHRKDEPRTMLGNEQFSWLIDVLHASTATFKLVAIGSQVLTDNLRKECYSRMPEERQKLIDAITASGVKGVMFLSGDIHASELSKLDRPGTYPLYEFTCSSLTAGSNKDIDKQSNAYRVPGTTVGVNNFGMITVTGAAKQRKLILRVIDHEGNERWMREISETELR